MKSNDCEISFKCKEACAPLPARHLQQSSQSTSALHFDGDSLAAEANVALGLPSLQEIVLLAT